MRARPRQCPLPIAAPTSTLRSTPPGTSCRGWISSARLRFSTQRLLKRSSLVVSVSFRFSRRKRPPRGLASITRLAKATLRRLVEIEPDRVWSWIDLGDILRHDRVARTGDGGLSRRAGRIAATFLRCPDRRRSPARRLGVVEEGRRRAGGAGRPGRCAEILSRRSRDCGTIVARGSRQRGLAARPLGVVEQGRRRAGGAGRPGGGAEILPRRSGDSGATVDAGPRQRGLAARPLGVV